MKFHLRNKPRWKSDPVVKARINLSKLERDVRLGRPSGRRLESGFYVGQTWGGLTKAWLAYLLSCKYHETENRKYYSAVIQKLEGELGLQKYNFPEVQEIAADFLNECRNDPEIQDMPISEIIELMEKSDSQFWKSIRGEI